jgi:peptidyl-prolyl cis-trans isomerase SurA
MLRRSTFCLLGLAACLVGPAAAQTPSQEDVVDRVVAVVGDSTVLQSQVEFDMQRLQLQDSTLPQKGEPGYSDAFRKVLDSWVDRLLVVQAAAKDSLINVDEAAIDQQVSGYLDQLATQFGGQAGLQQALAREGWTLAQYRDFNRQDLRQQQIVQLFMQDRLRDARPVDVSDQELLDRFQQASPQLQQRPRTITFKQVVVAPQPDDSAKARARAKADSLLARVRAGESFDSLARAYSDDAGTASLGGDLGWFRRGQMVPAFEKAAFSLPPGHVSDVVETSFGYHIIKVDRVRGRSEVQARHILIRPDISQADVARARAVAQQVVQDAKDGKSMLDLYDQFSDPLEPDSLTVPFAQLSQLAAPYAPALRSAVAGQVVGPLEYGGTSGDPSAVRLAVVKVLQVREAGAYTFEDVRARLAQQVQQEKQQEKVLDGLRSRAYVDIRY